MSAITDRYSPTLIACFIAESDVGMVEALIEEIARLNERDFALLGSIPAWKLDDDECAELWGAELLVIYGIVAKLPEVPPQTIVRCAAEMSRPIYVQRAAEKPDQALLTGFDSVPADDSKQFAGQARLA